MTATPPPPQPPAAHSAPSRPAPSRPAIVSPHATPMARTAEQIAEIAVAIARRRLATEDAPGACSAAAAAAADAAHPCDPDCRAAVWSLLAQLRSAQHEARALTAHMTAVERKLEG